MYVDIFPLKPKVGSRVGAVCEIAFGVSVEIQGLAVHVAPMAHVHTSFAHAQLFPMYFPCLGELWSALGTTLLLIALGPMDLYCLLLYCFGLLDAIWTLLFFGEGRLGIWTLMRP